MWIMLEADADSKALRARLHGMGLWTRSLQSTTARGLEVLPHSRAVPSAELRRLPGVADVLESPSAQPCLDAQAGGPWAVFAGGRPVLLAGPCSVESPSQIEAAAAMVAAAGGSFLRGGAFKPRTSPYSFKGHGRPALAWMRRAASRHGLGMVTEVMAESDVEAVAEVADIMQIGSRNMQNYALLREVGLAAKPVLLKRGMAASVEEWLLAGEHALAAGAPLVIFCERGIRGFDPSTRNLLDLGAVALLKQVLRQPVIVDPSHACGRRDLIPALARAALAAGADGLLVEAHPDSGQARSDGPQALNAEELRGLMPELQLQLGSGV